MARYKKIPFDKVAEVYEKKAGNVSATCIALGIDRNTFMKCGTSTPSWPKS